MAAIISLEIYRKRIKICEAVFVGRKAPVFRFLSGEISEETGDIANNLANLFKTHKLASGKVFLNIPRHLVMARIFHLPSVNDEEIRNMARMEAVKHMPYRDEDIITGYRIIKKFKDGYSDILLAVSQADTIRRLVEILNKAGLTAEKVALSSESLFSWYSVILKKGRMDSRFRGKNNIAMINIDSEYADMDIIQKGDLVFARAFSCGPAEPDATRNIVDEIKKSITIYQKERDLRIDKIFLSGREAGMKMLEALLKEELNIPLETVSQSEGIKVAGETAGILNDASFVELVGLSLKNEEARIDLLPEKMKEDREFASLKKAATKTMVLLACLLVIFFGVIAQKIFYKSRLLGSFNSQIKIMEPQVIKAKRMREDLKIIKNEIRKKPLAIDILSEIYKITPREISFNLLDYESRKSVVLRGNAPSLDAVVRFITILEDSQYFGNVKLKYTAKRSRKSAQKTDFEIICLLSGIK